MHGWAVMSLADAELFFYLSSKLGTDLVTDDEERNIQDDLRAILNLEQGTPVAIGSGKSSLKYKIRACMHSEKLTSRRWRRACEKMTCTATWVGDLGETGVVKVKTNLKELMGEWVLHADMAAIDEQAFDFCDEE